MTNHAFERRGDSVVEVRRASGESSQRWRLETTEIIPKSGDIALSRAGQLAFPAHGDGRRIAYSRGQQGVAGGSRGQQGAAGAPGQPLPGGQRPRARWGQLKRSNISKCSVWRAHAPQSVPAPNRFHRNLFGAGSSSIWPARLILHVLSIRPADGHGRHSPDQPLPAPGESVSRCPDHLAVQTAAILIYGLPPRRQGRLYCAIGNPVPD
jgi:hypothetical protein